MCGLLSLACGRSNTRCGSLSAAVVQKTFYALQGLIVLSPAVAADSPHVWHAVSRLWSLKYTLWFPVRCCDAKNLLRTPGSHRALSCCRG